MFSPLQEVGNTGYSQPYSLHVVRVCGIARRTPKRKPTTLHNPNTPFLFIKLLRKYLNSNLLSFIFIILYFFKNIKVYKTRF